MTAPNRTTQTTVNPGFHAFLQASLRPAFIGDRPIDLVEAFRSQYPEDFALMQEVWAQEEANPGLYLVQ